jgi:putative phosphoesterase
MKIVIASDIHGSAFFCELLMNAIKKENPDKIIFLGDILYHGPRNDLPKDYAPKKVIEMLNPLKEQIISVRGNCEAEVDQMVLDFSVLEDYKTFEFGDKKAVLTHGHLESDRLPDMKDFDILLNGHTHIPKCEQKEGYIFMNPGSVSIPKENSVHSYMVFENNQFLWKNLENGEVYNTKNL